MRTARTIGRLGLPLAAAMLLGVAEVPAHAESPVIAEQQHKYRMAKEVWERKRVPASLAHAAPFARREGRTTLRSSGFARVPMLLKNVDLTFADKIGFVVRDLIITLEPKSAGDPVVLDRVDSFTIHIHRGELVMRSKALTALFNKHILDYEPRSLSDVNMETFDGRLSAEGSLKLWNGLPPWGMPASFSGTIELSKDNTLVFQLDSIRTLGIPVTDVLQSLGITLPSLISLDRPGVNLNDFSIELAPGKAFPLPELTGDIASARLSPEGLHLTFADAPRAAFDPPAFLGSSYIWIQSGDLKWYDALITNARVAMMPGRRDERLQFNLYDYRKQFAASVTQLRQDGMMVVTVP